MYYRRTPHGLNKVDLLRQNEIIRDFYVRLQITSLKRDFLVLHYLLNKSYLFQNP